MRPPPPRKPHGGRREIEEHLADLLQGPEELLYDLDRLLAVHQNCDRAGLLFYVAAAIFATRSAQASMMGGGMPMDVNEWVVRPLLMNVAVISLFLIPMIGMRLFAEEKNTGTIELLLTSPVRDSRSCWQMAGRPAVLLLLPGHRRPEPELPFPIREAGLEAGGAGFPGAGAARRRAAGCVHVLSSLTRNQIIRGRRGLHGVPAAVGAGLVSAYNTNGVGRRCCRISRYRRTWSKFSKAFWIPRIWCTTPA